MGDYMKKILYFIIILAVFFITACSGIDVNQLSDDDLARLSEKAIVCDKPYMRFGMSCCLDQNNNGICDSDEKSEVELEESTTTTTPPSTPTTLPKTTTTQPTTTTTTPTKSEYNLADYPHMFIKDNRLNAIGVVGDEASAEEVIALSDIITSLSTIKLNNQITRIDVGATKLVSEVIGNTHNLNLILVGTPCDNGLIRNFIKIDMSDCDGNKYNGWGIAGVGYIYLFKEQGHLYLVVTGRSPADVRTTGSALANYGDYNFNGYVMMVQTSTGMTKPPYEWDDDAFSPLPKDIDSSEPIFSE